MRLTGEEREQFEQWCHDQSVSMLPAMKSSAMCLSVIDGDPDVTMLLQIGAAIWFDKPLLIVISHGMKVPPRVNAFATEVVEIDERGITDPANRTILQAAITRVHDSWKKEN